MEILASVTAGGPSFAVRRYSPVIRKFPSALLPDKADSYKSDISVYSVHTHFGRTNKAYGSRDVQEEPLKKNFVSKSATSCCTRNP
jgi:hypothetical protein